MYVVSNAVPVYLGLVCRRHLVLVAGHAAREEAEHHGHGRERHRGGVVAGRETASLPPPVVADNHDHHQLDRQSEAERKRKKKRKRKRARRAEGVIKKAKIEGEEEGEGEGEGEGGGEGDEGGQKWSNRKQRTTPAHHGAICPHLTCRT